MATIDFTAEIDRFLDRTRDLRPAEVKARYGVSSEIFTRWRRLRAEGRPVHRVRGENRLAIMRMLEDIGRPVAVPLPGTTRLRGRRWYMRLDAMDA